MKFFKHFTDASDGRSMQALMNQFGLEGYAAYFLLMELCAQKIEKRKDEDLTKDHFKCIISERLVRQKLRMRATKVELFLNSCATLVLLEFVRVGNEFHFSIPKLLECMDRDTKRARAVRADGAPKIEREDEDKDKERESTQNNVLKIRPDPQAYMRDECRDVMNKLGSLGLVNNQILSKANLILNRFPSIEVLEEWSSGIAEKKGYKEKTTTAGRKQYFVAALLGEIGAL